MYIVELSSCGNIDFGENPNQKKYRAEDSRMQEASSLFKARELCREFIENNKLGGGNWTGGKVYKKNGVLVAYISYNGRIWKNASSTETKSEVVIYPRYCIVTKDNQDGGTETFEDYATKDEAVRAFEYIRKHKKHQPENADEGDTVEIPNDCKLFMDVEYWTEDGNYLESDSFDIEPIFIKNELASKALMTIEKLEDNPYTCSSSQEILELLKSMDQFGLDTVIACYEYRWDENESTSRNLRELAEYIDSLIDGDREEVVNYLNDILKHGFQRSSSLERETR